VSDKSVSEPLGPAASTVERVADDQTVDGLLSTSIGNLGQPPRTEGIPQVPTRPSVAASPEAASQPPPANRAWSIGKWFQFPGSQLVAEGKILEDHVVVATAGHGDRPQEQECQCKHVLILSGVPAESNTGSAMTTFWRTTASARAGARTQDVDLAFSRLTVSNRRSRSSRLDASPRTPVTFRRFNIRLRSIVALVDWTAR